MLTRDDLLAAFTAGFRDSAEGFNGEYVGRHYLEPGVLEQRLREDFDDYMSEQATRP